MALAWCSNFWCISSIHCFFFQLQSICNCCNNIFSKINQIQQRCNCRCSTILGWEIALICRHHHRLCKQVFCGSPIAWGTHNVYNAAGLYLLWWDYGGLWARARGTRSFTWLHSLVIFIEWMTASNVLVIVENNCSCWNWNLESYFPFALCATSLLSMVALRCQVYDELFPILYEPGFFW